MSAILKMHVRSGMSVTDAELLRDASTVLGVDFARPQHPMGGVDEYFVPTVPGPLMLLIEDDSDPADFPIGEYRYHFSLDISGVEPGSTPASAEVLELMRRLYDGLLAAGRYTCTVVFDYERLLATNDPAVQASQN